MRRSLIAMAIIVLAALGAAAGASAKTAKPVLTLSEELGGGLFRPLEPGDPYFAHAEAGNEDATIRIGTRREAFFYGCHSYGHTTYFGKLESNGQQKDKILLEGVTGALNGETTCESVGVHPAPDWGEVTITVSGFPWEVTLGPWPSAEGTKAGRAAGTLIATVHSSVLGSCVYSGKFGKVKPVWARGQHVDEPPPQDWWVEAENLMLTQGTCPKRASLHLGVMQSLGPGETPIHLSVG